jgi:hypothetical protein
LSGSEKRRRGDVLNKRGATAFRSPTRACIGDWRSSTSRLLSARCNGTTVVVHARPSKRLRPRRLRGEIAVSTAVKDLVKAIGDSVAIIAQLPKDEWGRIGVDDVTESGKETTYLRKTSSVFRRFTVEERGALSSTTGKYRTAAKRLRVSVTAAWNLWEATLAEYKGAELIGCMTKPGRKR